MDSIEETTDVVDPVEPLDPEAPLSTKTVTIGRDVQEELPTRLLMILDDSISNASNIPRMLEGVKDLLAKFKDKKFSISVYTTGNSPLKNVNYSIGKYVSSVKKETLDADTLFQVNTLNFIANKPLAEYDSELSANTDAFFAKVEDYFKSVQASTVEMTDSTPDYHCQLLAYFKELLKKGSADQAKHIVLVSSDENTQLQSSICHEKLVIETTRKFTGNYKIIPAKVSQKFVRVSLEKKKLLEGGTTIWSPTTQVFLDVSCNNGAQEQTNEFIRKNPDFRIPGAGLVCSDKIAPAEPEVKEKIYNSTTQRQETLLFAGATYAQQVTEMQRSFNKGLLFYGTFTIRNASEQSNNDQEVGLDHDKYARLYAIESNLGRYGVTQSNYEDFVDEVFVFDLITSNNYFSLTDHGLDKAIVQSVKLTRYNGTPFNRLLPFSQTANAITVTDASINLNEGCELEVTYQQK